MVDAILNTSPPGEPLDAPLPSNGRPPRKLVDASAERAVDETMSLLDRVTIAADARRCNAKDGPTQIGRMHAVDAQTPIQAALDAFYRSATAPYRAEGQSVSVTAFFRMEGGRHAVTRADAADRDAVLVRAGLTAAGQRVSLGRGTLEQVRRVTQALLDAGMLEPGPGSLGERVRGTMWRYGIGIDCAGYAQQAFLAARGAAREDFGLRPVENEDLQSLAHNPRFACVDAQNARPGDLFILGAPRPGDFGHCVVVYSHAVADARTKELLLARCGTLAVTFLRESGALHVFQVDSSWGAGKEGAPYGGVRRDTWLYDAPSDRWARYDPAFGAVGGSGFVVTASPCDHPVVGVFRPKNER